MSSLLKIMVDVNCQVYCDYELKGEASPNALFRIELRKGNYILEFRQNDDLLLSQEYEMESNDEERLLRVSLSEAVMKNQKERQFEEIAALNIIVSRNYGNNIDEVFLENKDTHEKIHIPYNVSESYGLDKCGLLNVNIGGIAVDEEVGLDSGGWPLYHRVYTGGTWGCINKLGHVQIPIIYDNLIYFHSPHIAVARLNGNVLFIDRWNRIVFENTWDTIIDNTPFRFGKCIVEKNGKRGVIDEMGNEVLPLVYSKINRLGERGQFAVQIVDKWGLMNDEGKTLYPIALDSISYYYSDDYDVYKVKVRQKEGLLESTGRLIFPIIFDKISIICDYIIVKQDGLYGLYHKEKQILPIEFEEMYHKTTSASSKYRDLFLASKNHLWGVFDSLGNTVLPNKYNKIEYNSGGRGNESFVIEKDGKWGYISIDGNTIPPIYDSITVHQWHLKCLIVQLGERFGLVSTKGEVLLPIEYLSISIEPIRGLLTYNGFVYVKSEDGFGIYSDAGSCIIKPEYKEIRAGYDGYIVTAKDDKKGLFSKNGNTILPELYEDINYIEKGVIATKSNNVWQLWNYSKEDEPKSIYLAEDDTDPSWANELKPIQFKSYNEGHENQLIIEMDVEKGPNGFGFNNGNYAVFDYKKHKLIINNCDDIQKTIGDCYVFDRCGKKGLYNKDGEVLYPNVYDEIVVREELIYAIQDGCYVIYDYNGVEVFEKKYKKEGKVYGVNGQCGERSYSAHLVTKDGKWGCLNYDLRLIDEVSEIKKVKEIVPCEYDYVAYEDKTLCTSKTKEWDIWDQHIQYFVKKEDNGDLHYYKYQCHESSADIIEDWIGPNTNAHYLFIDTETTGLPKNRNAFYYDEDNWPYLVQISMIVLDSQMVKIAEKDIVLKPEKYTIPQSASSIHGITNEYAQKHGKNRKLTLEYMRVLLQIVEYVIGHNVDFDMDVLKAEFYREWTGDSSWYDSFINSLRYNVIDTMKLGVNICKIPSNRPEEKYKWPTLDELYKSLFGKTIQGRHNALNDVRATEECFEELKRRKLIK